MSRYVRTGRHHKVCMLLCVVADLQDKQSDRPVILLLLRVVAPTTINDHCGITDGCKERPQTRANLPFLAGGEQPLHGTTVEPSDVFSRVIAP